MLDRISLELLATVIVHLSILIYLVALAMSFWLSFRFYKSIKLGQL